MALSALALCARALLKIGAQPIASLDEGTAEAEVAANLYPGLRDALLAAHPWSFATGQATLPRAGREADGGFPACLPAARRLPPRAVGRQPGARPRPRLPHPRGPAALQCRAGGADLHLPPRRKRLPAAFRRRAGRPAGGRVLHPDHREHRPRPDAGDAGRGRVPRRPPGRQPAGDAARDRGFPAASRCGAEPWRSSAR